jgi:hypothetical protein
MIRTRIKYQKIGAIRFTSHRDTMRIFRRCFASSGTPVVYSEGFNPHPRLSFGPSLRTGWEGWDEYMDVILDVPQPDLAAACNPHLPEGLRIVACATLEDSVPKISADVCAARYAMIIDDANFEPGRNPVWDAVVAAAVKTVSTPAAVIDAAIRERAGFPSPDRDAAPGEGPFLLEFGVSVGDGVCRVEYVSTMVGGKSVFPEDLLTRVIGDPIAIEVPVRVARTDLFVKRNGEYLSPIDRGVVQKTA